MITPLAPSLSPLGRSASSNPLLRDLVSYWTLDEASGTRNDSHGTNHLTDNNTVAQAAGKIGNSASFVTANTEYLSRASNATLLMGDIDFTVAAWVWLDTINSQQSFVSKAGQEFMLHCSGSFGNRFCMSVFQGGGATERVAQSSTFGVPSTSTWYFVVGWHDAAADTVNVAVNGGAADSAATLGALAATTSAEFRIGARVTVNQRYLTGRVDAVGLWKRVLTAAERTTLYNSGNGLAYPF